MTSLLHRRQADGVHIPHIILDPIKSHQKCRSRTFIVFFCFFILAFLIQLLVSQNDNIKKSFMSSLYDQISWLVRFSIEWSGWRPIGYQYWPIFLKTIEFLILRRKVMLPYYMIVPKLVFGCLRPLSLEVF